jgi:type III secretion system FlhB-like substrate exporter
MNKNFSKGMQLEKAYQELFSGNKSFDSKRATMGQLIIKRAVDRDIPIHKDKELLTKLARLELERDTPELYYPAVAEIITHLNKLDHSYQRANA